MAKQVLFPTDFSPCAERAFSHAAHLTAQYGARLHILSVLDDEREVEANPLTYLPLGRDELAAELGISEELATKSADADATRSGTVNVTITAPSPWRAILSYADENEIDLIVMGTHGRHGVDRVLMGSVAEQVVRRAQCPVLTVRSDEADRSASGPILVPIDFSTFTHGTIAQAVDLARAYDSSIHLLHVIEPVTLPTVYGIDPMPAVVPDMEARARRGLDDLAGDSIPDDIDWTGTVLVGHAVHEIVTRADDVGARMIVLATHGLTGFRRLLMGSVTEHVVREASCPVFTVRSFGKQLSSRAAEAMMADEPVNL